MEEEGKEKEGKTRRENENNLKKAKTKNDNKMFLF